MASVANITQLVCIRLSFHDNIKLLWNTLYFSLKTKMAHNMDNNRGGRVIINMKEGTTTVITRTNSQVITVINPPTKERAPPPVTAPTNNKITFIEYSGHEEHSLRETADLLKKKDRDYDSMTRNFKLT
jgi:hypothetical protein